jgi:hypothetical protein
METASSAQTIDGLLPASDPAPVLDEKRRKPQCQKMAKLAADNGQNS